jgi:release factor glutamine methyltransferase
VSGDAASVAAALGSAAAVLRAAGIDAPRREARLLMQHALRLRPEALLASDNRPLDDAEATRLSVLVSRRAGREPLAYVTGVREFWSLEFAVDRSALVPRPETETVVEAVLARTAHLPSRPRLLDLGTGSGCLLVALLSERRGATGLGIDINADAVSLARGNAARHGLDGRGSFVVADWCAPLAARFDVVVSNPPYVTAEALASLAPEIACHEPRTALAGGADGYACYRRLAPQIACVLAPAGLAAIEVGAGMADEVATLFAAEGLAEIERRTDLAGIDRCVLFGRGADAAF